MFRAYTAYFLEYYYNKLGITAFVLPCRCHIQMKKSCKHSASDIRTLVETINGKVINILYLHDGDRELGSVNICKLPFCCEGVIMT